MRKYITAFFTFLGYCTFTIGIGLCTFFLWGYHKNRAAIQQPATITHYGEVTMTPVKTPAADTTAALPYFQPISKSPKKSAPQVSATQTTKWTPAKTKTKTTKWTPAKKKPAKPVQTKTVLYTSLDDEPVSAPAKQPTKWTPKAKTVKAKHVKAKATKTTNGQADMLGTSIVRYTATDAAHSNTRATRGYVPDVTKTTALEIEVRRKKDLEEIKAAAELLRNPPVWGSNK